MIEKYTSSIVNAVSRRSGGGAGRRLGSSGDSGDSPGSRHHPLCGSLPPLATERNATFQSEVREEKHATVPIQVHDPGPQTLVVETLSPLDSGDPTRPWAGPPPTLWVPSLKCSQASRLPSPVPDLTPPPSLSQAQAYSLLSSRPPRHSLGTSDSPCPNGCVVLSPDHQIPPSLPTPMNKPQPPPVPEAVQTRTSSLPLPGATPLSETCPPQH